MRVSPPPRAPLALWHVAPSFISPLRRTRSHFTDAISKPTDCPSSTAEEKDFQTDAMTRDLEISTAVNFDRARYNVVDIWNGDITLPFLLDFLQPSHIYCISAERIIVASQYGSHTSPPSHPPQPRRWYCCSQQRGFEATPPCSKGAV